MAKDYIIQKAVEFGKVKKKIAKDLDLSTYEQQAKYDGCCAILLFDEDGQFTGCYSRTGEKYVSMTSIGEQMKAWDDEVHTIWGKLLRNVAVIGEAWWPGKGEFNNISGAFRRGQINFDLQFAINDVIPLPDFNKGKCDKPYDERVADFRNIKHGNFFFVDYWMPGSSDPQERCNQLVASGGFDGLILRKLEGAWKVGSGNTGEIIKIKQKLSFDLKVLEVNVVTGAKTGRNVYKLVVDFRGNRLGVGSGVPHDVEDVPSVGDIVEVEAMDYSSDGLLREPRFKGIRFDKAQPD